MTAAKELLSRMEQKWGYPILSTVAWHEFRRNGQMTRVTHTALGYRVEGQGIVVEKFLADALWQDLDRLPCNGLLVLRSAPSFSEWEPAYDTNPPDHSKKPQTSLYVRLSFVDGPTEKDLKSLPCYKPEGFPATLLGVTP